VFKLLIADDEAGSREWLTHEIPWENNDICVVGPAINGTEAWDMFQKEKPELILTDIRMPGMNGIELARAALSLNPHTRILVISGYDEFAYAKACLEIGICGYLLKPSPQEEILQAILKERDVLLAKRADEEARSMLQTQLENSIPILREQFLHDLLHGEIEETNLPERLCFLLLPVIPEQPFITLTLEIEDNTGLFLNYDEKDRQLIWFVMYNLVEASLGDFGFAARLERGSIGALIFGHPHINTEELAELADQIARDLLDQARLHLPCPLVIGIGGIVKDLNQIYRSFEQAKQALRFHSQFGVEAIATHSRCYSEEKHPPILLPIDEEKLSASLETGTSVEIIHTILQNLYHYDSPTADAAQVLNWQRENGWILTASLVRIAQRAGFTVRDVLEREDYTVLMQGGPTGHPDDIIRWWETQLGQLGYAIRKLRSNTLRICIRQVKEYIDAHLSEAVTLSHAAKHVYMSPSYLSRLFREHTNESFSEYVTRRKMEEARRLLDEGENKVYEVAAAVGYTDPAYFGRVFRQYFNVTPTDYRGHNRDDHEPNENHKKNRG
jgi:two-component system response regulator YesN